MNPKYLLFTIIIFSSYHCFSQGFSKEEMKLIDKITYDQILKEEKLIRERSIERFGKTIEYHLEKLAIRKSEWQSYQPAAAIGGYLCGCKEKFIQINYQLTESQIDDIIFQYKNPYGDIEMHRKLHSSYVTGALACIGKEKTTEIALQSIIDLQEHTNWGILTIINDERILPLIKHYHKNENRNEDFKIIKALEKLKSIKTLPIVEKYLFSKNRALQRRAIEILKKLEDKQCIDILKKYIQDKHGDKENHERAYKTLIVLERRIYDGIWPNHELSKEENIKLSRLYKVLNLGPSFKYDPKLVSIYEKSLPLLRRYLRGGSVACGPMGARYLTMESVLEIMEKLGDKSIPYLIDGLYDELSHVREYSYLTLKKITKQNFENNYLEWKEWYITERK